MTTPQNIERPAGWPAPTDDILKRAVGVTLAALTAAGEPDKNGTVPFSRYYDVDGNYAGATFTALEPNTPHDITAADLHAVRLLSVELGASATRRLLNPGEPRDSVIAALEAVPTDVHLADATAGTLSSMAAFYEATRSAMRDPRTKTSNAWVAPTKLTARKRPDLIPVRDNLVRRHLGLEKARDYRIDWQVMRHLANDEILLDKLQGAVTAAQVASAARGQQVALDTSVLRLLDVSLWERARAQSPE